MTVRQTARRIITATSRRATRVLVGRSNTVARLRSVLANLAARVNGDRATAAAFMAQAGADADTIRRYASQLGIRASKLMRAQGTEPLRDGLAVVTRHGQPVLVRVNTYPAAVLAVAVAQYKNTAHLIQAPSAAPGTPEAPMPEPEPATIDPRIFALQLADRYFRLPGKQNRIAKTYTTTRVAEITSGMHRRPDHYDPATDRLTQAGAAVVEQIISTDAGTGYAWREIGQLIDDEAAAVPALNGAS